MLIILSPAKKINVKKYREDLNFTSPLFLDKSIKINNKLKELNPTELKTTMKISESIFNNVFKFIHNWNSLNEKDSFPAIFGFDGEAFRGLNIESYTKEDLEYSNNHLRILSGLYGILKPLDKIKEYRLEMGTKLDLNGYSNLYSFWGDLIKENLEKDLLNTESNILVNLASKEYSKSAKLNQMKDVKVVTPIFKEYKNGKFKVVTVHAKRARGLMASYIIKNKINSLKELKKFNEEGYKFREDLSNDEEFVFILEN